MTKDSRFGQVENTLEDYIEEIGDEIEEVVSEEDAVGFSCQRGSSPYQIIGYSDVEYFVVWFQWDLLDSLANEIEEEDAEPFVEKHTDEDDLKKIKEKEEDVRRLAARVLLHSLDEEYIDELRYQLSEEMFSPLINIFINEEEGIITGYEIQDKIFPYEESFSPSDLEKSVQAVVTTGKQGIRFLSDSFNLDFDEMKEEAEIFSPETDGENSSV